jgi:Uri superfamily endonuclease
MNIQAHSGTYALILSSQSRQTVQVGSLGRLDLKPGFYVYIGSAFGPGGLKARLGHHLKVSSRPRWHIDYLRPLTNVSDLWFTYDPARWEHQWADLMSQKMHGLIQMPGFGSSDCACLSHLFHFPTPPSGRTFIHLLHAGYPAHQPVHLESFTQNP